MYTHIHIINLIPLNLLPDVSLFPVRFDVGQVTLCVSLFQDCMPWLSGLNMIFDQLQESTKSISLVLDSVFFNNSYHEIHNINMDIINCTLTNYKLLFKGDKRANTSVDQKDILDDTFKCLSITRSKLKSKIIGELSMYILGASASFYDTEINDANQKVPVVTAEQSELFFMYCNFSQNVVNYNTHAVIMIEQSKSVIENCTFTENIGRGRGIIHAFKSIVNITASTFKRNQVSYKGGVIYSQKATTITILNSIFKYNRAYTGGVIYVRYQTIIYIYGSIFLNNSARNTGGALYGYFATRLTIENTQFTLNSASNYGGSISVLNCKVLNINNSYFDSSSGKMGGAIFVVNATYVSVNNTHFNRNVGTFNTGALRVEQVDKIVVRNCTFTGNVATLTESAITAYRKVYMTIDGCTFKYNVSPFSGILMLRDYVQIHVNNTKIIENTAKLQSLMEVGNHSSLTVTSSLFSDNKGGSIIFGDSGTKIWFINCTFSNHTLLADPIMVMVAAHLTLQNSNFSKNHQHKKGGIVLAKNGSFINVQSSFFKENYASKGGVFYLIEGSYLQVNDSRFKNNSAGDGSVAVLTNSKATFKNVAVVSGTTIGYGGILTGYSSKFTLLNCIFSHGTAVFGGCVYLADQSSLAAHNSVFKNSYAKTGGAIFKFGAGNVSLDNCTLTGNMGYYEGSIYQENSNYLRFSGGYCDAEPKPHINCITFQCEKPNVCFLYTYHSTLHRYHTTINSATDPNFIDNAKKLGAIFGGRQVPVWKETPFSSCKEFNFPI